MNKLQLFQDKKIRSLWDAEKEEWYFSVVDICGVLSGSAIPRNYWSDLKRKLITEGSELHEKIVQLKLVSSDGKKYLTDVLDTQGILRLIQSIPSPNAEPFKVWLAKIGAERLDEIADPEKAILRGADYYRAKGYTDGWISERLKTIEVRKKLTDEWKERGIDSEKDFAILTNEMTKVWSGKTVGEYKAYKNLKKENLRDNMTDIELVLNSLAEITTTAISKKEEPETFDESKRIAHRGGSVAKNARNNIEDELGINVISSLNATDKPALETKKKKE